MCKAMEDMRNEAVKHNTLSAILNLMKNLKLSAEDAMNALEIPREDRAVFRTMQTKAN